MTVVYINYLYISKNCYGHTYALTNIGDTQKITVLSVAQLEGYVRKLQANTRMRIKLHRGT